MVHRDILALLLVFVLFVSYQFIKVSLYTFYKAFITRSPCTVHRSPFTVQRSTFNVHHSPHRPLNSVLVRRRDRQDSVVALRCPLLGSIFSDLPLHSPQVVHAPAVGPSTFLANVPCGVDSEAAAKGRKRDRMSYGPNTSTRAQARTRVPNALTRNEYNGHNINTYTCARTHTPPTCTYVF